MPLSHQGVAHARSAREGAVQKPYATGPPRKVLGPVDGNASRLPKYPKKRVPAGQKGVPDGAAARRQTMVQKASENANRRATGGISVRGRQQVLTFTSKPSGPGSQNRRATQLEEPGHLEELEELRKKTASQDQIVGSIVELKDAVLNGHAGDASRIEELVSKIGALEERIAQGDADLAGKVEELGKVSIALASEEQARKSDQVANAAKLSEAAAACSGLEEQLKTLNTTMAAVEADKKFLEASASEKVVELEKLQAAHGQHDAVVEKLQAERDSLSASIERAAEVEANLEQKLDAANSRLRDQRQEVCNYEMAAIGKDTELRKLRALHDALQEELDAAKSALATEKANVTQVRGDLRKTQKEAEEEKTRTDQEVSRLKREHDAREKDLEGKLRAIAEDKEKADASQRNTNVELQAAQSDLAQFRATISTQEGALAASKSQLQAVQMKLDAQSDLCSQRDTEIAELRDALTKQTQEIAVLEEQAHVDEEERRRLHNCLQELKGNIRVFCRVRPVLKHEDGASNGEVFSYTNKSRGIVAANSSVQQNKSYNFDRVFDPSSTQEDVFGEISQLVQSALDGYRVCIFAYGQTGSGKTHTIMGSESDKGMIPRSVQQIFDRAARMEKDSWNFTFKASFLEIYNEEIRDLLGNQSKAHTSNAIGKTSKGKGFQVSYTAGRDNMCTIEGLTVADVSSPEVAATLIDRAAKNRATAATRSNAESSRSHSVFRLFIDAKNTSSGQSLSGLLNLVDLAGSERVKASGAEGARLKETQNINKSLTQLGVVIQSLANKQAHVPFRNSVLTKVLQDSLGGDSKALMFVNVAPTLSNYSESTCALSFAERVNACEIGVAKRSTKIDLAHSF